MDPVLVDPRFGPVDWTVDSFGLLVCVEQIWAEPSLPTNPVTWRSR